MQLTHLCDAHAELVSGGSSSLITYNTYNYDYSWRQRANATAPNSNNLTNNVYSFSGSYNVYAFGSNL